MHDLDQSWLSKPGVSYFRYVDDILILTKRVSHRKTFRAIQEAVLPLGLKCHDLQTSGSKSTWGVLADQVDYLGYSVGRNLVSVRAESVMRLKEKLAHRFLRFAKALKEPHESSADEWRKSCESRLEWYLNLTIAGCVLDDHRRGWIHYFSLVTDFGLLRSLDYFVEKKVSSLRLSPVLSVKSFVRAYRRAARVGPDRSGYVPNFDRFSETEQRRTLLDIFLISPDRVDRMSSPEVETEFYRRLRRELESLETDLAIAY